MNDVFFVLGVETLEDVVFGLRHILVKIIKTKLHLVSPQNKSIR